MELPLVTNTPTLTLNAVTQGTTSIITVSKNGSTPDSFLSFIYINLKSHLSCCIKYVSIQIYLQTFHNTFKTIAFYMYYVFTRIIEIITSFHISSKYLSTQVTVFDATRFETATITAAVQIASRPLVLITSTSVTGKLNPSSQLTIQASIEVVTAATYQWTVNDSSTVLSKPDVVLTSVSSGILSLVIECIREDEQGYISYYSWSFIFNQILFFQCKAVPRIPVYLFCRLKYLKTLPFFVTILQKYFHSLFCILKSDFYCLQNMIVIITITFYSGTTNLVIGVNLITLVINKNSLTGGSYLAFTLSSTGSYQCMS